MQVEPNLSIFKKAMTFNYLIEKHSPIEVIRAYAEMLSDDSDLLYKIVRSLEIDGGDVEIQADCHLISIDCSDEMAKEMIEEGLVSRMEEMGEIFPGKKVAIHLNDELGEEKYAVEYMDDSLDEEFQSGHWLSAFDIKEDALSFINDNGLIYSEEDFYSTI